MAHFVKSEAFNHLTDHSITGLGRIVLQDACKGLSFQGLFSTLAKDTTLESSNLPADPSLSKPFLLGFMVLLRGPPKRYITVALVKIVSLINLLHGPIKGAEGFGWVLFSHQLIPGRVLKHVPHDMALIIPDFGMRPLKEILDYIKSSDIIV